MLQETLSLQKKIMINDFDKSSIEMIDWSCANCGCTQWMPKELNDHLIKNHKTFYCLHGHGNHYSKKTEIEEIQGKLMNEYAKNAQLEKVIIELKTKVQKLERSFINRIFKK